MSVLVMRDLKSKERLGKMEFQNLTSLIKENYNEVEAFIYRGDEHNKLLTKLIDSIRALMRANAN